MADTTSDATASSSVPPASEEDKAAVAAAGACEHCAQGFNWHGETKGTEETLGNLKVYVAKPSTEAVPGAAIMLIHDAFGWTLINNRLLADRFAEATGITAYVPDFYENDVLLPLEKIDALFIDKPTTFVGKVSQGFQFAAAVPHFLSFLNRHSAKKSIPLVEEALAKLKEERGATKIGVVGYCWGGKYALRCGADSAVKAVVAAHPSMVLPKEDLPGLQAPVLLLLAGKDFAVSKLLEKEIEEATAAAGVVSEKVVYEGTQHGFAVRCNESDKTVREARDDAAERTAAWFNKHLKE